MGMDLAEGKRGIGFSSAFWYDVLQLGLEYGWEPMGVGPPAGVRKAGWGGGENYWGNDGQRFYARDARALAAALERALAARRREARRRAAPAARGKRPARPADYAVAALSGQRPPRGGEVEPRELTAEDLAHLRRFIRFCRAGGFRIY